MYIPASFREEDSGAALDLLDAYGFATLMSWAGGEPMVSHVPLILDRGPGGNRLLGHLARANDHWRQFDGHAPALAVFHGPHGYVSPGWYVNHPSVPTWNYAVVHVRGAPTLLDDAATAGVVERLIEQYERPRPVPWVPDWPATFFATMLQAVVGFALPITQLEAKFKLSQNRAAEDREGALAGLEADDQPGGRELAAFARRHFARNG